MSIKYDTLIIVIMQLMMEPVFGMHRVRLKSVAITAQRCTAAPEPCDVPHTGKADYIRELNCIDGARILAHYNYADKGFAITLYHEMVHDAGSKKEIGHIKVSCTESEYGYIQMFTIASAYRAKKYGKLLMACALRACAEWGYTHVQLIPTQLDTVPTDVIKNIYEHFGFVAIEQGFMEINLAHALGAKSPFKRELALLDGPVT
jgi:GNAT superfamily N-acetyltransferase